MPSANRQKMPVSSAVRNTMQVEEKVLAAMLVMCMGPRPISRKTCPSVQISPPTQKARMSPWAIRDLGECFSTS